MKLTLVNGDASESAIKNAIMTYLHYRKVFCWINESVGIYDVREQKFRRKNSQFQLRGTADILGIFNGRLLAIEVKSAKGVLSCDQAAFLKMVERESGIAFVARSVADVEGVLFS